MDLYALYPSRSKLRGIAFKNKIIKKEEKSVRVLERLYLIRFLYKRDKIKEACEKIDITEPTGYGWLDSWNKGGYVGLAPNFSGGPKPKLGEAERDELKRLLAEKDAWTLKEVRILIKKIQCRIFRNASLENIDIVEYAPCQALCSR